MTRRIFASAALCLGTVLFLAGCSAESVTKWRFTSNNAGIGETEDEHYHRSLAIEQHARRGLVDDMDLWFLTDRPTRLTRWHEK
jgi:hypothetical protein